MGTGVSLKLKINLILGLLLLSILLCWGSFYSRASSTIEEAAESLVSQASGRVSDLVYTTFSYLEHTAMVLSTSETIGELLREDAPLSYYALRDEVAELADSVYQPNGLVDNILLYDLEGNFCRLRGDLGNTAATRLSYLIPSQTPMQHGMVTLEGDSYLSYVIEVLEGEVCCGYVVFLMATVQLQNIFTSYDSSGLLSVSLVSEGNLLGTNTAFLSAQEVINSASNYSLTTIGTSPFSVLVWDDGDLNAQFFQYFILIALTITTLLVLLMGGSYRMLNALVFTPALKLMDNAKEVAKDPTRQLLDMTGQEEFDQVVTQFNHLILELDERTKAAFDLERAVQRTEIERQNAILASLKKQISAHFTVNTLSVIRGLNGQGEKEKVSVLCDGLAYILRYAYDGEESISCLNEVIVLEKYASMMQIRYPNRFTMDLDIDYRIEEKLMPRMLLQPIIENAILHGFANKTGCHLTMWGCEVEGSLRFVITDNGWGMEESKFEKLQASIKAVTATSPSMDGLEKVALQNVQKRILCDFGSDYGIEIVTKEGEGTEVTVRIAL